MQPSPHSPPDPVPTLALTGTQTRFSQEPADQTVVAGQRAVLPCVLLNYSGIVQWTKDGLALGMGQGLKGEWGSPAPSLPHLGLPPLTNKEYWTQHPFIQLSIHSPAQHIVSFSEHLLGPTHCSLCLSHRSKRLLGSAFC